MQQEIRHVEDGMRWLQHQADGRLVEFRIVATRTGVTPFVIFHIDGCTGTGCSSDCDAEGDAGEQVRFCWALADHNDDAIWATLRRTKA